MMPPAAKENQPKAICDEWAKLIADQGLSQSLMRECTWEK
jgi:hypothetical protein